MYIGLKVWWCSRRLAIADVQESLAAVRTLAGVKDGRAVAPLLRALDHPQEAVQTAVAEALGSRRVAEVFDALLRKALCGPDSPVGIAAIESLEEIAPGSTFTVLSRLLRTGDENAMREALGVMRHLRDPRSAEVMIGLLSHCEIGTISGRAVRIQTALIDALGDIGDSRAAALLLERLEAMQPLWCVLDQTDGDKFELLVAIVKALGRVGEPRAIAPLRKVLRWSVGGLESLELENRLQKAVVESLALLGEPNWRQWMLGTDDATVKEARLGGQDYYCDVWFGVRLDDAERLAKSGEECACEVALPVLVRRSGRKVNARQQRAYSLAVKKLGTRRAAEVLVEALLARVGDSNAILLALKEMRESSVVPLLVDSLVARPHLWSGTTTRDLARTVLELGYAPTDEEGMKKLAHVYSVAHEYEKAGE